MQQKSRHALIAVVLVCLIFSSPLQAQATYPADQAISSQKADIPPDDGDYTVKLIGQIGGQATKVAIQGNYAYLSLGFKLAVLDISIPSAPRLVSEIPLGVKAGEVVLAGPYAYVTGSSILYPYQAWDPSRTSLYIVDISDPAAGHVTGSIALESPIPNIAVYGSYVFAGELGSWSQGEHSGGGVRVVDVRDPAAPRIAGFYNTQGIPSDLAVEGQTLYVAEDGIDKGGGGLRIFDLKDPASPVLLSYFPDPIGGLRIAVSSRMVYLVSYNPAFLWIIDATSPSAPVELSRIMLSGASHIFGDLIEAGGWVYLAELTSMWDATPKLRIFDARDSRQPQVQPDVDLPEGNYPQGLAVAGGRLYVCAQSGGLHVMDLTNPAVPVQQGVYIQPGVVNATAVAGQNAYLTDSQDLYIVDLSQLERPRLVSRLPTGYRINKLAAAGELAFLAGQGLQVVDAADPTAPQRIGFVPAETLWYWDIDLQGQYAYLAAARGFYDDQNRGGGLRIFDISDPTAPTLVGSLDFPFPVFDIAVAGEYVYVINGDNLFIVRVSDPQNPVLVNLPEPISAFGLELVGRYLFVLSDPNFVMPPAHFSIRVLDLSSPTAPREVGRFGDWTGIMDMDAAGRYLYLATSNDTVDVWDIHDLAHPTPVGYYFPPLTYDRPGGLSDLIVADGNAYLSAGTTGLLILRYAGSADGRVRDFHGKPVANVSVAADDAATALTDSSGSFNFSSLPWDGYNLYPELPGYAFWPPQQEIVLPGAAHGVNFILLAAPVSTLLQPGLPASLGYTDTQGLLTSIDLPASAASRAATLTITPTLVAHQVGYLFTGHAFTLSASPDFVPAAPLSVTIQYSDQDVWSASGEEELRLRRWNGASWEDAAQTCSPEAVYARSLAENTLRLPICQFGLFALFRPGHTLYLPMTVNQY